MLPLWIIDIGTEKASAERLGELLTATGESLKPYWHYYHAENMEVTDVASCKAFVDKLVDDGRKCYNSFIEKGYKVGTFQIVISGAADEALSQEIFAPLAGLIRDNMPRIVADHANLGVDITGVLYVPSTVNQLDDVKKRTKVMMLLEQLNMLNECLGNRHFNRLVAYQDVQYKGDRFYPGLNTRQRTELLFQILTNLFFAGVTEERLFDKINDQGGIYSLGAASVYYNSESHQAYELKKFLDMLVAEFKDRDNLDRKYSETVVRNLFKDDALSNDEVTKRLREGCSSVDIDLKKLEDEADPHPVWDLLRSDLFPRYYHKFLRYMPARLKRFMQSLSYILLTRFSGIIRKNREKADESFRLLLQDIYRKVFLDSKAEYATIAQVEDVFRAAKDFITRKRDTAKTEVWEIAPVPAYLRNDYDRCAADEDGNTPSKIIEEIKKNLKREPVVLALLVRCFLLGILLVFTIIPVLRVVSPKVINLGEIATIEWLWIPVIFFLPLIIHFCIGLRRHFGRIRRLKFRLLATTLLAVNKRLSKLLYDELTAFYNELAKECDRHLELLASFRDSISIKEVDMGKGTIPQTMFNQPLINGEFCGEKMLEDESIAEAEIRLKEKTARLAELGKEDLIQLLKDALRKPVVLETVNLSDKKNPEEHAQMFVSEMEHSFVSELRVNTAEDVGSMIEMLGRSVNMAAFRKMANVNGMLFSVSSNNRPVIRIFNAPLQFGDMSVIADKHTADYALLTCWQKITPKINSQAVCNCTPDRITELSFADRLSLYYGYYRQTDLAFNLAGFPIRIAKEEMETLDKELKEGRL